MLTINAKGKPLFAIEVPILFETGVRKKRKNYLNLNQYRNAPFHLNNTLKKMMLDHVISVTPEEFWGEELEHFSLRYTVYLPNELKRDVNNILSIVDKFVCDAFVHLGIVKDDNYEHLKKTGFVFGGIEKGNGRVLVELFEEKE